MTIKDRLICGFWLSGMFVGIPAGVAGGFTLNECSRYAMGMGEYSYITKAMGPVCESWGVPSINNLIK